MLADVSVRACGAGCTHASVQRPVPKALRFQKALLWILYPISKSEGENEVRVAFLKHKHTRIAPHSLKCILGSFSYA